MGAPGLHPNKEKISLTAPAVLLYKVYTLGILKADWTNQRSREHSLGLFFFDFSVVMSGGGRAETPSCIERQTRDLNRRQPKKEK